MSYYIINIDENLGSDCHSLAILANQLFEDISRIKSIETILDVGAGGNDCYKKYIKNKFNINTLDVIYYIDDIYFYYGPPKKVNDFTYVGDFFKLNAKDSELNRFNFKPIDLFLFWGSLESLINRAANYSNSTLLEFVKDISFVAKNQNKSSTLLFVSEKYPKYPKSTNSIGLLINIINSHFRNVLVFNSKSKEIVATYFY